MLSNDLPYVIDQDERGIFRAHVEDYDGNVLYETPDDDPHSLFEDGWMKNKNDIKGLEKYLKSQNIIEENQRLIIE